MYINHHKVNPINKRSGLQLVHISLISSVLCKHWQLLCPFHLSRSNAKGESQAISISSTYRWHQSLLPSCPAQSFHPACRHDWWNIPLRCGTGSISSITEFRCCDWLTSISNSEKLRVAHPRCFISWSRRLLPFRNLTTGTWGLPLFLHSN